MKVKLLKKVRKEWSILYYPKSYTTPFGDVYHCRLFQLCNIDGKIYDSAQITPGPGEETYTRQEYQTEKECIDYLKRCLIRHLRDKYKKFRFAKPTKVWYEENRSNSAGNQNGHKA